MTNTEFKSVAGTVAPFTADIARQMFSFRGKSANGQGVDVSFVRKYYHPDVLFRDAIQEVRGRDAVIEMLLRFPQRCHELRVEVHDVVQQGQLIFVEWRTEMVIRKGMRVLWNDGCTRLRLDDQGLVVDHRDYFDLWGDLIDAFPKASKLYRRIIASME